MDSQRLSIPNGRGEQLAARLDLPEEGEPGAFALVSHCFTCGKDLKAFYYLGKTLAAAGLGALRVDFTGLGESEGDFGETDLSSNVSDLLAAAEHLEEHYRAPRLLVGHSLGGAAALLAAARLPSVSAVAVIATPSDPAHLSGPLAAARRDLEAGRATTVEVGGQSFPLSPTFFDALERADLREAVGSLEGALLILHSPRDRLVGLEHAEQLFRWAHHPKSFVSLAEADHVLSRADDARYAGTVIAAWARPYLRTPPPR